MKWEVEAAVEDQQLQVWVEQLSLQYFGRPFQHKVSFNRRLRSTGGRYFTKNHNIDISWLQYESHGTEETEKIIKHELCHYHLHIMNKGFKHRDPDFRMLLKTVGGTRFCKSLPAGVKRVEPFRYRLECVSCQLEYLRKRKVNIRKFACGKCRGKLRQYDIVRL